jgi:hypothetical protein
MKGIHARREKLRYSRFGVLTWSVCDDTAGDLPGGRKHGNGQTHAYDFCGGQRRVYHSSPRGKVGTEFPDAVRINWRRGCPTDETLRINREKIDTLETASASLGYLCYRSI